MRRVLIVCVLVLAAPVYAQWTKYGYEQITVTNAAVGFATATLFPNGRGNAPQATAGSCRVGTAQIRWRYDGPAATSSVGTLAEIGDVIPFMNAQQLVAFSAIRTGSTSAVLSCTVGLQ